jgi:hypothetical protein
MVYRGKVQNGQIVLDGDVRLPEGTTVEIAPIEKGTFAPIKAFLDSGARWHGTDEEFDRLLAELKQSKQDELQRQLREPEPRLD